MKNKNIMFNSFQRIISHLNERNLSKDMNLYVKNSKKILFNYDSNLFFKSGQLLAVLYLFNTKIKSKESIGYSNGTFYIKDLFNYKVYYENLETDCLGITERIIDKSVYNKVFLPYEIVSISDNQCKDIESGFSLAYNILLEKKFLLIDEIKELGYNELFSDVINNLKTLNFNDLSKQIQFIRLRFKDNCYNYKFKDYSIYNDYNHFVNSNKYIADQLIESSIIGFYNNNIEITWISNIKNNTTPLAYKNVYLSLFLSYLSKIKNNNYYLQSAIQAINPAIRSFDSINDEIELRETLKAFYLLNESMSITNLKNFLESTTQKYKYSVESILNKENLNEYLLSNTIKTLNEVII